MEEYLGCIKYFGWSWAVRGYMVCDGRLLQIQTNTALFALLGTNYGGDGIRTFAIPDLRPIENGVRRPFQYEDIVPQICTEGVFPSRAD